MQCWIMAMGVFFAGDKRLGSRLLTRWCTMVEQSLRSIIIKHHSIQKEEIDWNKSNRTIRKRTHEDRGWGCSHVYQSFTHSKERSSVPKNKVVFPPTCNIVLLCQSQRQPQQSRNDDRICHPNEPSRRQEQQQQQQHHHHHHQ